ncbi:MAG: hypothetical protein ACREP5_10685, partial [Candidatus Binatia bacterium]
MEQLILTVFLALFALEFIVEFGLNELNLRHVQAAGSAKKLPDFFQSKIEPDDYDRSVQYTLAKGRFQRWNEVYDRLITLWIILGALAFLDRLTGEVARSISLGSYGHGIMFCLAVGFIVT